MNPLSDYDLDLEEMRRQQDEEDEVTEPSEQDGAASTENSDPQAGRTSTATDHSEYEEELCEDPTMVDPPFKDPNDYSGMPFSHKAKGGPPKGKQPTAKPLKPLNIGGSRDAARKSGTRNVAANQIASLDEEREKRAAEEKAAARNHELEMIKLIFGAGPSSGP